MKHPSVNDAIANLFRLLARRPDLVNDDELWAACTMVLRAHHYSDPRRREPT